MRASVSPREVAVAWPTPHHGTASDEDALAALIECYNAGSRSIEQLFDELLRFSNTLDDEQVRHVREQLTEEELVIHDILTRPAPALSTEERAEVKKVARDLCELLCACQSCRFNDQ